jgi:chromosome partitioning protein
MRDNAEAIAKEIGTKVFTPIRECSAVKEAQATQTDIYSYSPRCNASKDYALFVEDILSNRK